MNFDGLFQPLTFRHGGSMKNRLALAPLTNLQSHSDGTLTEQEMRWLEMRAEGGFGMLRTAGSYVQAAGQAFAGQIGCSRDAHIAGLARLADRIHSHGALALVQLYHGGKSSLPDVDGGRVGPSDDAETATRGLSIAEVEQLRDDFIAAAVRVERAGFDGAEIDGAHGYLICSFLSPDANRREDGYGGDLEGRSRLLFEVVEGVRAATGPRFMLGLRLSAERFVPLAETVQIARRVLSEARVDYLEMSLWDVWKEPFDEALQGRTLASYFSELPRGGVRLAAAGRVMTPEAALRLHKAGFDFITLGRAGILNHDFPNRVRTDAAYEPLTNPAPPEHLAREGVGPPFVDYLRRRFNFVADPATAD